MHQAPLYITTEEEIETLSSLFPCSSIDSIQDALRSCNGNLDEAVDYLLSTSPPAPPAPIAQDKVVPPPPPPVLKEYLNNELFSDITLVPVTGESVPAHLFVICARSVLLESLFSASPVSNHTIRMEGMNREELLSLLEYLYTDNVEEERRNHNLLKVADEYCLPRMREICEQGDISASTFLQDMKTALESGLFSDVTFVVEDKEIKAHKLILCKSCEYFRAMFLGNMKERNEAVIQIEDTSHSTFVKILGIIYGDNIATVVPAEQVLEFFVASTRFTLPELQVYCEEMIKRNLDVDNVTNIANCVWGISQKLTPACEQYILKHYHEVKLDALHEPVRAHLQQEFESKKEAALHSLFSSLSPDDQKEIVFSIKMEACNFLNTHLSDAVKIPDQPLEIDGYDCEVSNVDLSITATDKKFSAQHVQVELTSKSLVITVKNFTCSAENTCWRFQRKPNGSNLFAISDEGTANIYLKNCEICIIFSVDSFGLGIPKINLTNFCVKILDIDIVISHSKIDWVYNALLKVFKSKVKQQICEEIKSTMADSLKEFTDGINKFGLQLLEDEEKEVENQ